MKHVEVLPPNLSQCGKDYIIYIYIICSQKISRAAQIIFDIHMFNQLRFNCDTVANP